jgi:aryl-alcohol dehydrogenase-like predicted oxidoreductase
LQFAILPAQNIPFRPSSAGTSQKLIGRFFSTMKKRVLGRTGLLVSEIGFGSLEIGRAWGLPIDGDFAVPGEREVAALLDRVLDLGINLIDTAPAYMLSEERIGKLLKPRRKEFYLATKCGESFDGYRSHYDFSKAGTLRFIETSLRRLRTDYVDLIQIHCGANEVETVRQGETLEGMLSAKKAGKVRWVGISCEAPGARAALDTGEYDVLQLPYSLLNRAIEQGMGDHGSDVSRAHEGSILSRAAQANVGIIIREALERGNLTEKVRSIPSDADPRVNQVKAWLAKMEARGINTPLSRMAIQFVLRHQHAATVLVGTRNPHHLEDAIEAASHPFDSNLLPEIDALGRAL